MFQTFRSKYTFLQEEKPSDESGSLACVPAPNISSDTKKFLAFAETHRTVLNQILRQSTIHLADGPFAVLVSRENGILPDEYYELFFLC